jgi:hypothetical protein
MNPFVPSGVYLKSDRYLHVIFLPVLKEAA